MLCATFFLKLMIAKAREAWKAHGSGEKRGKDGRRDLGRREESGRGAQNWNRRRLPGGGRGPVGGVGAKQVPLDIVCVKL